MKVMVFAKASPETAAAALPTKQAWDEMDQYNEELAKSGILLDGAGLKPGVRIRFSGQERIVTDGPFAETKELVAGYSIWEVESLDEAIAWAKRCPLDNDAEVEIRPIFLYSPEEVSEIVSQDK